MAEPFLRVDHLSLVVFQENSLRQILDRVSFNLFPNQVMGLVGESGSGKTMTSLAVMRLLPRTIKVTGGHIWFDGQDLFALSEHEMRRVRGSRIAMVFQNPRAALNPLVRAGDQVARAVRLHQDLDQSGAYGAAIDLMQRVGIADAVNRARAYPHQLSGGMAQRVLIAMMLACQPRLLIADEPTTGLDVTIQAQIFELIKDVQRETGAAVLLITHDLGVVSEVCDRVAVMYAGQIMEVAPVQELFAHPCHPYTQRLLSSVLRVDRLSSLDNLEALAPVSAASSADGCLFASQCPLVTPECLQSRQDLFDEQDTHIVYCCNPEAIR